MPVALANALWITLIGMGLVFVAILLLWGLMALMVRLTAERQAPALTEETSSQPAADSKPALGAGSSYETGRKRLAAAAAVAAALALRASTGQTRVDEPAASVSAWLAVHRASQISQRIYSSRKKVVR